MGKISIITPEQKIILACIAKSDYLRQNFYFTGGTVLSEFYLQHRYSDDLDFFTEKEFNQQIILTLMTQWSEQHNFRFTSRFVEVVYRFDLRFSNKVNFTVDFGIYPYKRVEKGAKYQNLDVDSLRDIATNKLMTINQRTDVKDFVDLYFLLKRKYSFWDLLYSAEIKFKRLDIDRILLAQDFLKIDDFQTLPKMIKPLTIDQLKKFFRQLAKSLGSKAVEK